MGGKDVCVPCGHLRSQHGVTGSDEICGVGAKVHHPTQHTVSVSFGCGCPYFHGAKAGTIEPFA